jgi:hypothetical protein
MTNTAISSSEVNKNALPTLSLTSSLIISVGEARKVLGVDAKGRTDDEIAKEVLELTDLAQKLLNTSILPKKTV